MPGPYYCTNNDLRAELAVDNTVLPDVRAARLIADAEDIADSLLGAWPVDETTGRKIVPAKVEGWQADKLARFTVTLAARLYREPGTVDVRRWRSESVPDFSVAGPVGGVLSPALLGLLDGSGLRRLAVRARPSGGGRSVLA